MVNGPISTKALHEAFLSKGFKYWQIKKKKIENKNMNFLL